MIGRDNQNRIRWGNLLTLPVGQGGLLYVAPVYASPGASDAASSYPRLIRVAMMYGDKVGYGPTVRDALDGIFGAGAGATATGPAPAAPRASRAAGWSPRAQRQRRRRRPTARGAEPGGRGATGAGQVQLSGPKAAALQEIETAMEAVKQAQQSGNFAEYGEALQRLDDAMTKYDTTSSPRVPPAPPRERACPRWPHRGRHRICAPSRWFLHSSRALSVAGPPAGGARRAPGRPGPAQATRRTGRAAARRRRAWCRWTG